MLRRLLDPPRLFLLSVFLRGSLALGLDPAMPAALKYCLAALESKERLASKLRFSTA